MVTAILLCLVGLAVLVIGAEVLVRAAVRFATLMGISPMVVGLTVVALGTSAPELAVGIDAAMRGNASLAIGNIAGTNIVNILLILGLTSAILPLDLERRTIRFDLPVMVGAALLLLALAWDGHLGRIDGAILVGGAVFYTWAVLHSARAGSPPPPVATGDSPAHLRSGPGRRAAMTSFVLLLAGIAIVVFGADLFVDGATAMARLLGVSEAFIGLTVVAIGTSAPELVTTLVSTLRGNRDVAVGNLIGSSAYNILAILGITALVPAGGMPVAADLIRLDIPIMTAVAVICVPIFMTHARITRTEGALFVLAYMAYLGWLIATRT